MGGKQGQCERSQPIWNFPMVGGAKAVLRTRVSSIGHEEPAGPSCKESPLCQSRCFHVGLLHIMTLSMCGLGKTSTKVNTAPHLVSGQ